MRVVLDTNVWVSGLLRPGLVTTVTDAAIAGRYQALISAVLLHELSAVLRRPRFAIPTEAIEPLLHEIHEACEMVEPTATLRVVREDPADNRVLECAMAGHADLIVSGDHHLLNLREHAGIPISSPASFRSRWSVDWAKYEL